jgi:hypothetical protein
MRNRQNQDERESQIISENPERYQYFLKMFTSAVDVYGLEKVYTSSIESIVRLSTDLGFDPAETSAKIIGVTGQVCYRKARSVVLYSDQNREISTSLRSKYISK